MYFEDVSQSVMRELARIHRGINCEGASCKGGGHTTRTVVLLYP